MEMTLYGTANGVECHLKITKGRERGPEKARLYSNTFHVEQI